MTTDEAINELTQCYSFNSKTAEKKNEAISMAIKALEKRRWILATEQLPEVGQRVLVTTKDGFIDIRKCIDAGHLTWFYSGILAWMPFLLKPYKEENKQDG